jgi:NodT family efflux transporter outer membrane factor (OMF) lipoprotein
MTACVSGRYQPTDLKEELRYTDQIAAEWHVDEQWWKAYRDPELDRLIDLALERNPDYLKTALTIDKELASLSLSTSDLFPTLKADLGASAQSAVRRTDHYSSNFSGELGLNYEVDLYGKIRQQRSAQLFETQASIEDLYSARLSLINSVTDLYYNLTYLQNAIDLTRNNIKAYEEIYQIADQKYQVGRSDSIEALQARQSVLTEQNRLLQLETQFNQTTESLKNILAVRPNENFEISFSDLTKQKTLSVDLNVPTAVLALRPDLRAAQYRLEKSFKNLQAEEKNWYPTVSVSGSINSASDKARTTFDFPFTGGSVAVNLPFLDWNRVRNNVKISEADYKIAAVGFADTLTQALNEIAYYDFAYEHSLTELKNIEENYQTAVQITDYYKNRYTNGKVEFRYYLEALNRENSLREDLVSQKYQIIKYENYIFKALGGRYTPQQSTASK